MRLIKSNVGTVLTGAAELLTGILLFIDPRGFTSTILTGVGIVLLAWGVICVLRYFREEAAVAALEQNLAKGLILILLGGFLVLRTDRAIGLFPLLTNLYGVAVLVVGVMKVQQGVDLFRLRRKYWFLAAINAALAILFAALILGNPFASTMVLWRVAAISLIVEGALDLVVLILAGKGLEEMEGH